MSIESEISINRTGDEFIDSCFHFDLIEYDEKRDYTQMSDAVALVKKGNEYITSNNDSIGSEAIAMAETLIAKYPNFDFCRGWLATLYMRGCRYDEAKKAIDDGLLFSRSKYWLCMKKAQLHLKLAELDEAVRWWIRSLVLEVNSKKQFDSEVLLYLSYVAEALELNDECQALRDEITRSHTVEMSLSLQANQQLDSLSRMLSKSTIQAIALFVKEYIVVEFDKQLEELRKFAPKGIYCNGCNKRYSVEQITWFDVGDGSSSIFYKCPTCQCNLAYYPKDDLGD